MMKLKSVFKFGDLDNQEEVYNGGVIFYTSSDR